MATTPHAAGVRWLCLVLVAVMAIGCAVVIRSDRVGYTWWFYPGYDVYYTPTVDAWAYWTGHSWVVVDYRPAWLRIPRGAMAVRLDYRGPTPWVQWHLHRRWYAYDPVFEFPAGPAPYERPNVAGDLPRSHARADDER